MYLKICPRYGQFHNTTSITFSSLNRLEAQHFRNTTYCFISRCFTALVKKYTFSQNERNDCISFRNMLYEWMLITWGLKTVVHLFNAVSDCGKCEVFWWRQIQFVSWHGLWKICTIVYLTDRSWRMHEGSYFSVAFQTHILTFRVVGIDNKVPEIRIYPSCNISIRKLC